MRYLLSRYCIEIFLYLCLICYETLYSSISANATSSNSSEEIKNIFSLPEATDSVLKGAPKTGNFAEGGPIIENFTQSSFKTSIKSSIKNLNSLKNISASSNTVKRQNISSLYSNVMPTKLTETESNLFLGMPEVIHDNGTSSIKPRKGAQCNKIVPRKGVDNESEASHGFLENQSCLWLNENECYSTKEIKDLGCFCCEEGNTLRKEIIQQAFMNCKNCKSDDKLPSENKQICKNICCNSVAHDIYSITKTQDIYNDLLYSTLPSADKKQQKSLISQISDTVNKSDFPKKTVTENENLFNFSKKNSKLKPSITKVPYDVEVVTEILSKDQQKIFIPIVVLLFLLPLIGILMFFLWQRVKEYWNKRYYKKTDFLIDGMYND